MKNSRESLNKIGKKVRLSRENVDYRIKRMTKEGLITKFNTIFNEKKLGLLRYGVFLELISLNDYNEKKILEHLKESKNRYSEVFGRFILFQSLFSSILIIIYFRINVC